jgi:hypothetical protein
MNVFNFSRRKVGGIWFYKLGRFSFSFCLCSAYYPVGESPRRRHQGGTTMVCRDSVPSSRYVASAYSYDRD